MLCVNVADVMDVVFSVYSVMRRAVGAVVMKGKWSDDSAC